MEENVLKRLVVHDKVAHVTLTLNVCAIQWRKVDL